MRENRATAIGFFQNPHTAEKVFNALQKKGFKRSIAIQRDHYGKIKIKKAVIFRPQFLFAFISIVICLILVFLYPLAYPIITWTLIGTLFGIFGWGIYNYYHYYLDPKFIKKYANLVVSDETLVLVQVLPKNVSSVLSVFRHVESGHPTSFLIRNNKDRSLNTLNPPHTVTEPLTNEQLIEHARELASSLKDVGYISKFNTSVLKNLNRSEVSLKNILGVLGEAEFVEQTVTISAEWLLDNAYVIQGNIDEIRRNLPKKFYKKLPRLLTGPYKDLPRVYVIAKDIVNSTGNRLTRDTIINYINNYQEIDSLTIAELWVLPLMLRLRLIECLQFLAIDIERRLNEGEEAFFWGNRLLNVYKREPERLPIFLKDLENQVSDPSYHFAEELIDHLYDEEAVIPLVKNWLEKKFDQRNLQDIIRDEQLQKSVEQVAISSAIVSLITLSQLSWRSIFEQVSVVDQILSKDPSETYSRMDFNTRDCYRHVIEIIARYSKHNEISIAKTVLNLSEKGGNEVESHVGYYLVDKGRDKLEKDVGYSPSFFHSLRRKLIKNPISTYLGGIFLLTLSIECLLVYLMIQWDVSWSFTVFLSLLALIPASEVGLQIVSLLLTKILKPFVMPKFFFEQGIPAHLKTLVVVPSLLSSEEDIKNDISQLEIHYLANSDAPLRFGIFYDHTDAPEAHMPSDQERLDIATEGIKNLERKYGEGKFFLFFRERTWSKTENAWIGRERKRGKLECLNRYLVQANCPEMILKVGDKKSLEGIIYVITLDADTELPKDTARQLVETISHPLNAPRLTEDGKVQRGYTIIQPRVTPDITHSRNTLFSRIFSDAQTVNPYNQTVSDVYQDLMSEGNYHGKGIYDLKSFYTILDKCFPEEHLLSHDLLEGVHVRVGFASDIILTDLFPQDYYSWSKRMHRWMRGDWQILDWIFPRVPCGTSGKKKNPLELISRWKIFDNLRRSLLPITLLSLLLIAFFVSSEPVFWVSFVLFVFFIPSLCLLLFTSLTSLRSLILSTRDLLNHSLRALVNISLLPQLALLSVDVLVRVFYRRFSRKKLLQWETYKSQSKISSLNKFVLKLGCLSLFGIIVFDLVAVFNPTVIGIALPFCFLWLIAPALVHVLDQLRVSRADQEISFEDKSFLRMMGRKTWRYFDDFVGPQSHWLPPDNYQAALTVEVAQRTSPTNIGLWMLAVLAANDLKYISVDQVLDRLLATFNSFKKLEMYEGHFLNWYDTQNLKPLYPRYVSTVDSGNLLASFWALEQGLYQLLETPLLSISTLDGVRDTFHLLSKGAGPNKTALDNLSAILNAPCDSTFTLIEIIRKLKAELQTFTNKNTIQGEESYWVKKLEEQLNELDVVSKRYYPWFDVLNGIDTETLQSIHPSAIQWRNQIFRSHISLKTLAELNLPEPLQNLYDEIEKKLPESTQRKQLKDALQTSQWLAGEKIGQLKEIITDINQLGDGLNMRFLYNKERKLFSIGYHVDDCRLDNSYYDLLASEARIASFVAIAKNDVPLEHWWALGRPYGYLYGRHVLMSWGGTMFEYLMPLLFKNFYPDSLMGKACEDAVACQVIYGERRGIPWGISEAAYSAIDMHKIYQYRSFGVPGLGFKRGLEEDLVVSPYSTALALAIDPKKAIKNLKEMGEREHLFANFGYYESIDFTRQSAPHGKRGVIVYAFMAHHQGMSFLAINNILNDNVLRKRFHSNPRVCGMESLLYEKPPVLPAIAQGSRKEVPVSRLTPIAPHPIMGISDTPHSALPKVNLLSNNSYSVMTTNSGGGQSCWKNIDITRWRSDPTSDYWGSYLYIKDLQTNQFWSVGFQPTAVKPKGYSVSFKADRTEFKRLDNQIESSLDIVVSPEDDVEIRLLTLRNLSKVSRDIEITSYMELALAPHATDAAHPCFNKLFIETEFVKDIQALLAFRRKRSPDDSEIFAGHIMATTTISLPIEFETDRDRFVGRGNSLSCPLAMKERLSNSQGFVLDPIFSLRHRLSLAPGERIQLTFVTAISDNREKTMTLLNKYTDLSSCQRALEMAWAHAQLELRHLRIHQEEVQLYQKLASRILYPHSQLRPSFDRLLKNKKGQSGLWAYGISGDLPIVVASIADVHEMDLIKQVLTAHIFLRMRGLKTDLVILNEESAGYEHPLYDQLLRLIHSFVGQVEMGKSGGVYLLNIDQVPEEDITLLLAVASVNLIAARGSLRQQLVTPLEITTYPARLIPTQKMRDFPSALLPFIELNYFNGIGGFSKDGKEYMIFLDKDKSTPAPWINVIANKMFGTLVSETGLGVTWYGNSQSNRLTPWSNDPLLNPISDTIYIRDEELGTYWTPTPGPIREVDPYRIRHGAGYTRFEHNSHGLEQDLTVFVPIDDDGGLPLRIQRLRIKNTTNQKRYLSAYSYTEWVLGVDRERTQMHVITEWDAESQALFAFNRYNMDFGNYVGFATSYPLPHTYTGNRTEFIGRNNQTSNPNALKRKKLSGLAGPANDSCAALQVCIELEPNEEKEVFFILGYAQDQEASRKLVNTTRETHWMEKTYQKMLGWWDKRLSVIQINTPDESLNYAFNRWLLYQSLSCRFWGRTAFYQSSGAFGFRDQLQDSLAFLYSAPALAREQILLSASRQFIEGDVQHWWHPPSNGGVRTRISDDLLWLPFVTAQYIRVTNDSSILDEQVSFIKGELLREDQHEAYFIPEISDEKATLLEHCRRALKKGLTEGPHGLPLIGGGDWNDGMNRVGIGGKGESVWLAWFLVHVMNDFADLLSYNTPGADEGFRAQAKRLAEIIEEKAWDGNWYLRGYFDDGTPLGSAKNEEAYIDSISQSWAVISGAANPERVNVALKSLEEHIIKIKEKMVLLLTTPFNKTPMDPGYIKGYPPGVRENGGQYTHGSLWTPLAFARMGQGDKAVQFLRMMHPISHTSNKNDMLHYKDEPYVLAGDVYSLPSQLGRGGWSWYTGSSAWMYRIILEEIIGFTLRGHKLTFKPVLPKDWNHLSLTYMHHSTSYNVVIENAPSLGDKLSVEMDSKIIESGEINLIDDGLIHQIVVKKIG